MTAMKLYIIHCDFDDGSHWHYVGVTAQTSLAKRLGQHRVETRKHSIARKLNLARRTFIHVIVEHANTAQERFLKCVQQEQPLDAWCPTCQQRGALSAKENAPAGETEALPEVSVRLRTE